jgi:hypothetical protein
MMHAMVDCGCLELRFGVESGSDKILRRIKIGFYPSEVTPEQEDPSTESCGAHSPRIMPQELATRG